MTISTMNDVITALPGQRLLSFKSTSIAPQGFGSHWVGGFPTTTYPGASLVWVIPTSTTAGACAFVNPTGGAKSYLARFVMTNGTSSTGTGVTILYDRLAVTGAITPAASTQTLSTTPITRPDSLGVGVELWWEWISPSTSTAANLSCSYTNQAGTAGRTTDLIAGITTSVAGQMQQLTLPDTGVRSVESFTSTAAIGGTGMLVLLRRIAMVPTLGPIADVSSPTPAITSLDVVGLGMPQIYDNACLALMGLASAGAFPARGFIDIIQG